MEKSHGSSKVTAHGAKRAARAVRAMPRMRGVTLALLPLLTAASAHAFEIESGNPDLRLRWDNTVKYSAGVRVKEQSPALIGGVSPNKDDGDRNFGKGPISNRLDLLSEFDATYGNFGARVSGAAWYDSIYHRSTDNTSPLTYNPFSVPNTEFTRATRDLHGQKAELLDAFLFGKSQIGETTATYRLGRHTLLWGESLFFGENGIAAGQAPIDVVKLLSVPNTQFKELIRPTNQLSGQLQVSPAVSIGGYYQLDWEKSRIPASGSYFSRADLFDAGGERLIVGAPIVPGGGPAAFFRGQDSKAKDSGQGGIQIKWRPANGDYDLGFYATRYHDKNPQVYVRPSGGLPNFGTGQIGTYDLVYAENIKSYGFSVSRSLDSTNLAAEVSVRRNTPLVATGGAVTVLPGQTADNDSNPLYPVGNSLHAQVSAIHTLERNSLWDGGLVLAEVAWHRRTSITKNAQNLDPNTSRDAWGLRMLFSPTWYQAYPGLDLSMPIGLGYNPKGNSSVITLFNGGWNKGGDLSIGLTGEYLQQWKGGITYTHYFGAGGTVLDANNNYSFKQSLKDRNFVSVTLQRTF